jgi:hypothetical protein
MLPSSQDGLPNANLVGSGVLNTDGGPYFQSFDMNDAFDTYIFCLSEHDRSHTDGLLSMWRGYGQHGSGVALVFALQK